MKRPVLVHTMGKVGSSSIAKALEAQPYLEVYQIHQLNADNIAHSTAHHVSKGLKVPKHLAVSRHVIDNILTGHRPVSLITLVRDPVARNISSFFQNLYLHGVKERVNSRPPEELIETFYTSYNHEIPLKWFDVQVKEPLGIDVFTQPFPMEMGFLRIKTDKLDMLILRSETPDPRKQAALQDFLGLKDLDMATENVSSNKKQYGRAFKAFLDQVCFPADYVSKMYQSKYAAHFYTALERDLLAAKWSKKGQAGA